MKLKLNEELNILILSAGTRNKIVQYFKRGLCGHGEVYVTDCDNLAPALYEGDHFFVVPKINDANYFEKIFSICKANNIKAVLSLIDPELLLLSKRQKEFNNAGINVIISPEYEINLATDKSLFQNFLKKNGFNFIKSYTDINLFEDDLINKEIQFPVFVKPISGSASININIVRSMEELKFLFKNHKDLLIQEYIRGKEFGIDAYIDLISGGLVSMFVKEKLKMRTGETDKAVSVHNEQINNLIKKFISITNFRGVIDIDIFESNKKYYISEINPRFGGGYPHAYSCGVDIPKMIINNINGIANKPFFDYKENIFMMKYNEIKIIGENI